MARPIMGVGSAPPPARRVAKSLRQHLGEDFLALVADIGGCDWSSFKNEVKRVLTNEECERKHLEHQAREAEMAEAAKTLPTPESPEEEVILRRHGFVPESPAPEPARTAS